MVLSIGDEVPGFVSESHIGVINLHDYIDGSWGVLLAFPRANDAVACSELGMLSKLGDEFDARNCKLLGLTASTVSTLRSFVRDTQDLQGCHISFPVVADATAEIMASLGMVSPDAEDLLQGLLPQTTLLVVDLDKRVRLCMQYPSVVGHNFYELIRAIDGLQLATFHQVGVAANWKEGEDVFISNAVPPSAVADMFPKGHVELRPWFRITAKPITD